MRCRGSLVAVLALAIAVVVASSAVGGAPRVGSSFYVVRPDPRLCPSPACGGYWVALANRSRTRCSDGALRPRCYVARTVNEERHPLLRSIEDGSLARADVEPWRFEGVGELGVLVVARVFTPAGSSPPAGPTYRVVDTGIRCVKAPCFSLRASLLNHETRVMLSGVDLRVAKLASGELARAESALVAPTGLLAQGRVGATSDGGRELRVTRVYLREPQPRA